MFSGIFSVFGMPRRLFIESQNSMRKINMELILLFSGILSIFGMSRMLFIESQNSMRKINMEFVVFRYIEYFWRECIQLPVRVLWENTDVAVLPNRFYFY